MSITVDGAPIRRVGINPVAKLAAALVIALGLVLSVDWVSAATALVLEIVLMLVLKVPVRTLLTRGALVLLAAALTGVTILLYGEQSGTVHWHFLLITVSDGSISLALATFLRVLAIALPSVILFIDTDPTELADGLGQVLRLPPGSYSARWPGCAWWGCSVRTGGTSAMRAGHEGSPTRTGCAVSPHRVSRCWSRRCAGDRCWRPRWRPAGSVPTQEELGPGRRGSVCVNPR